MMSDRHHSFLINYPYVSGAQIFVYKDQKTNKLYFSANDVAYCLGFDPPHEAIRDFIPTDHIKKLPYTNGKFLDMQSIADFLFTLSNDKDRMLKVTIFRVWLRLCLEAYSFSSSPSDSNLLCNIR